MPFRPEISISDQSRYDTRNVAVRNRRKVKVPGRKVNDLACQS